MTGPTDWQAAALSLAHTVGRIVALSDPAGPSADRPADELLREVHALADGATPAAIVAAVPDRD